MRTAAGETVASSGPVPQDRAGTANHPDVRRRPRPDGFQRVSLRPRGVPAPVKVVHTGATLADAVAAFTSAVPTATVTLAGSKTSPFFLRVMTYPGRASAITSGARRRRRTTVGASADGSRTWRKPRTGSGPGGTRNRCCGKRQGRRDTQITSNHCAAAVSEQPRSPQQSRPSAPVARFRGGGVEAARRPGSADCASLARGCRGRDREPRRLEVLHRPLELGRRNAHLSTSPG